MKKKILSVAGTLAVVATAITLIDFKRRTDLKDAVKCYKSTTGELLAAFFTTSSAAILAAIAGQLDETEHPERAEKLKKVDDAVTKLCTPKK